MADIDKFKSINDEHGHAMGDQVIQKTADALRSVLRGGDAVCRYGGEEFCILLIGATSDEAEQVAERARATIGRDGFTASFGLSSIESGAQDPGEMIDQADKALYMSKNTGRNRVTRWDLVADLPTPVLKM